MTMVASAPFAEQPGSRRYRLDGELARGGMGVVYRAFDRARGRAIALKRPLGNGARGKGAELLEREYRALVALRHPRIIEVHDYGHDEQGPFYTMELLDGRDLSSACPLPWREACSLLRDVASSLALVHARRLIHRDVSPANIRISGQHAKLLDFGTMVPFGRHEQIAGTPSCVAPEVFGPSELDQRVDLFALGATAYFALCGRAAYPATSLKQLSGLWAQHRPQPPSAYVPDIPAALDQLVMSLLALDPLSRPVSAGAVIDALRAVAELAGDDDERVLRSYLESPPLVGREEPRARLTNRLTRALAGSGGVLLVESALGFGKTALLGELAREALVRGALLLSAAGRSHREPLSAARALREAAELELHGLDTPLAQLARGAAGLDAPLERAERFAADNQNGPAVASEQQLEREVDELVERFLQLAARRPLVLVLDDADHTDAHSLEVLAKLSRVITKSRLLIVLSADAEEAEQQVALRPLRRNAMRVHLSALTGDDLVSLLRTLFGEVPDLKRLASWLERETQGSPLLCMELVAELIEQKRIRYADGLWFLPQDLSHVQPTTDKVFERRLARLSSQARVLAGCLSVRRIPATPELCRAIVDSELPGAELPALLRELVDKRVLLSSEGACTFVHSELSARLYKELATEQRVRVHRLLAAQLAPLSQRDHALRAEVGCHLFLAGDSEAAHPYFSALVEVTRNPSLLLRAIPDLLVVQQRYDELPAEQRRGLSVAVVPLLIGGLYVDPSVFDRVGRPTLDALEELSGMRLARRLARFTGATLAVLLGLLVSFLRWRFGSGQKHWNSFAYPLAYFGVAAQVGNQALFRLDRVANQACLQRLSPYATLNRRSIVRLVHDGVLAGTALLTGQFARSLAEIREMNGSIPRVRELDADAKQPFVEMNQFWEGRIKLLTAGADALEMANGLRGSKLSFHWILAELLRYAYYLGRGELPLADRARDNLDTLVARHGGTWTGDLLVALEFTSFHASGDVVGLKRSLDQLEALLGLHPSIGTHVQVARAMYEARRGKPQRALEIYESLVEQLDPFACNIWSFAQGHWVECLNTLSRHEEARARSERMLARAPGLAEQFPVAYQQLEREHALALCALGEHDRAGAALDALLVRDGGKDQPLLVGLLHRDRAVVAAAAGDAGAFEQHLEEVQRRFEPTRNPALIAQVRSLRQLGKIQGVETPSAGFGTLEQGNELSALSGTAQGSSAAARAERLLDQLVQLVGAHRARLYKVRGQDNELLAQHGADAWSAELAAQLDQLVRLSGEKATTALTSSAHASSQLSKREQLLPIFVSEAGGPRVVGVLVLAGAVRLQELTAARLARLGAVLDELHTHAP